MQKIKGYDFQIDYNWDMAGGQFSFRHLASYQPTNSTLTTPLRRSTPGRVQPDLMQTTFLTYSNSGWNVALQNRWLGSVSLKTSDNDLNAPNGNTQNYVDSSLDANDVVDITVSKEFEFGDGNMRGLPDREQPVGRTRSAVPVRLGTAGLVLSDAGLLRRHGPLLHRWRQR